MDNVRIALTRRQSEVAEALKENLTYSQVGEMLGCAERTVRCHVETIAGRLPYHHLTPRDAVRHYAITVLAHRESA